MTTGLTGKGLTDDLKGMYGDWDDTVIYDGNVIDGFLETTSDYPHAGDTAPGTMIRILHTDTLLPVQATVTVNGAEYKLTSRESDEGSYSYRLNRQ